MSDLLLTCISYMVAVWFGVFVGMFAMCLLHAASEEDKQIEEQHLREKV